MRPTRSALVACTVLAGGLGVLTAAPAAAVCDAYSQGCVEPPAVLPTTVTSAPTTAVAPRAVTGGVSPTGTPASLPFTGGELVLVSLAGAGAVAGGAALVVAGRRRAADTP